MLELLVEKGIEGVVPPYAVECSSRILMIQDVRLGLAKVAVVVVTAL